MEWNLFFDKFQIRKNCFYANLEEETTEVIFFTWKQENRWSSCSAEKSHANLAKRSWIFFTIASCFPACKKHLKKISVTRMKKPNLKTRVQLYKGRIILSNGQITIQQISDSKTYSVIHLTKIYPVDSVIQPLNNWGQYHTVHVHV